jgi:hypothetical protein
MAKRDRALQTAIRARHLQILVIMLSMLTEKSIRQESESLLRDHGIDSKRPPLELLFLKVLPLSPVNSKVFLTSLVPAVLGWEVSAKVIVYEEDCWYQFLIDLAKRGYLIPCTMETLCGYASPRTSPRNRSIYEWIRQPSLRW